MGEHWSGLFVLHGRNMLKYVEITARGAKNLVGN